MPRRSRTISKKRFFEMLRNDSVRASAVFGAAYSRPKLGAVAGEILILDRQARRQARQDGDFAEVVVAHWCSPGRTRLSDQAPPPPLCRYIGSGSSGVSGGFAGSAAAM